MKSVVCVLTLSLVCLAIGCGGSEEGNSKPATNNLKHPKHPNVRVLVTEPHGKDGSSLWHEKKDGWFFKGYQGTGENFGGSVKYEGTTDAGDEYLCYVKQGDNEIKEKIVYKGEELTVEIGEGVTFLFKPK